VSNQQELQLPVPQALAHRCAPCWQFCSCSVCPACTPASTALCHPDRPLCSTMLALHQHILHCRNCRSTVSTNNPKVCVVPASLARPCANRASQAAKPAQRRTAVAAFHSAPEQPSDSFKDQHKTQELNVNVSKRQLLVFGCAYCLSLQTQQLLPAAADSGHFTYTGGTMGGTSSNKAQNFALHGTQSILVLQYAAAPRTSC
jgi:hypothetical protein